MLNFGDIEAEDLAERFAEATPRRTVPEVLPYVRQLYLRSSVGCCLHIVLDDENVDNASVDLAIDHAQQRGHTDCEMLARVLRGMSRTQRLKLARTKGA